MFTNWKKKYEDTKKTLDTVQARMYFLENYFGDRFIKNDRIIVQQSVGDPDSWRINSVFFGGEDDGMSRYYEVKKNTEFGMKLSRLYSSLTRKPRYFESEPE